MRTGLSGIMNKILLLAVIVLSSCKAFYPSGMLRTGGDYQYAPISEAYVIHEYVLAPDDEISLLLSTNDGEKLLDPVKSSGSDQSQAAGQSYWIDAEGNINIPVLRNVKIAGLTTRQAEQLLEEKFTVYFNHPFVRIQVLNKRVMIFPGGAGGKAQVVRLENPNTTLFEALALAGGITDGKSYRIKLIRGENEQRKVFLIDLSRIEGLKQADLVLMANDIIYVEPVYKVPQTLLSELTPYLSLVTTALVIWALLK